MRRLRLFLPLAAVLAVAATMASAGARADDGDLAILGNKLTIAKSFVGGKKHHDKGVASVTECTATSGGAANTLLDCDDPFPNDEPISSSIRLIRST